MRGWRPLKEVEVTIYLNKEEKPYGKIHRMLYQHSHRVSWFSVTYRKQHHTVKYSAQKGWHIHA